MAFGASSRIPGFLRLFETPQLAFPTSLMKDSWNRTAPFRDRTQGESAGGGPCQSRERRTVERSRSLRFYYETKTVCQATDQHVSQARDHLDQYLRAIA